MLAQRKFDRRNCLMQGRSETGNAICQQRRAKGNLPTTRPGPGSDHQRTTPQRLCCCHEMLDFLHDFTWSPDQLSSMSFSTHRLVTSSVAQKILDMPQTCHGTSETETSFPGLRSAHQGRMLSSPEWAYGQFSLLSRLRIR